MINNSEQNISSDEISYENNLDKRQNNDFINKNYNLANSNAINYLLTKIEAKNHPTDKQLSKILNRHDLNSEAKSKRRKIPFRWG